jgi:hypothetical protein
MFGSYKLIENTLESVLRTTQYEAMSVKFLAYSNNILPLNGT